MVENVSSQDHGFYYLSVRGVRKINGDAGDTIEVPIPRAELRKLSDALRDDRAIGEPVSIEDAVLPTIWKFNQTLKMLRMSRPKVERLLANPDSGFRRHRMAIKKIAKAEGSAG